MPNSQPTHFLLAADIDGTMLGDETGEALLHQFTAQHAGNFTLAYITGRYPRSVLELIVNALAELKSLARQRWHYHSPYPAARGVLDGLHYFGFIKPSQPVM